MNKLFAVALLGLTACSGNKPQLISGSIDVKPELKASLAPTDTVFIIARKGAGGPPLAVKKVAQPTFPLSYTLSSQDVMMGGPFEGEVELSVRIDKDGDAMTKNPGDLLGKIAGPVAVGSTAANVLIDSQL